MTEAPPEEVIAGLPRCQPVVASCGKPSFIITSRKPPLET